MELQKFDIVNLIDNNPLIKLSSNYQNKLLIKIQQKFNEDQHRLFVSSFFGYINYNQYTDFVIDFDSIWKWLGFSRKEHCKVLLEKHFIINIDYKIITNKIYDKKVATEVAVASLTSLKHGGQNKEKILMTIKTFKKLCLKSNTKKADEIHDYYIKLEECLQETINEESNELRNQLLFNEEQLLIKDTSIEKLTKEKLSEKHNILLREFSNIGSIVYIVKVKSFDNGTYIVRIGESRQGILERYKEHKSNYNEAPIILDCFLVRNCKNFESFLHNQLKKHKVTNLLGHETENELFLIGKELSYSHISNVINQNIKYYNDDYTEIEKLRLENSNLIKIQELNNQVDFKNLYEMITNSNKMLYNKIDTLTNTVDELKCQINSINTKTVNNFNEPLNTVGPRVQKINPENLQLIKVYENVSEILKENHNIKRPSLNKAVLENTIYQGFRWLFVDRSLDPNNIHDIKPTKETRIQNIGYIAKLNSDKSKILKIYLDRKTSSKLNGYTSPSSLDTIVKKCKLSNGNYYILYNELSEELKESYIKPILYKNGVGKFDQNNNLIKEFICKEDTRVKENISNKSLTKALETGKLYNNYYYKFLKEKLEC